MHLFKILKADQSHGQVLNYQAQAIKHDAPQQALVFVHNETEDKKREFELNTLVSQNIGVEEIEKKSFREHIESEVLKKLQEVQEKAYKEAYDLGLQDGRKQAFDEANAEIKINLDSIAAVLNEIQEIKKVLTAQNESAIVRTIFSCAKAISLKEIQEDKYAIKDVFVAAIENAQTDEKVIVRVSPQDFDFVEKLKGDPNPQYDKLRNIRLEADQSVSSGGCVIETNYGVIDASIEERVSKCWKILESKVPHVNQGETNKK